MKNTTNTVNPYDVPESSLDTSANISESFHIVSTRKAVVLYFATFGIYGFVWFYQHWNLIKLKEGLKIWPVPRAIFSIFFTHSLFQRFEDASKNEGWSSASWASLYVLAAIISSVCDGLSGQEIGFPWTDLLSILLLIPMGTAIVVAQGYANRASGDPTGSQNERFTWVNYIFLGLALLFWLFALLGYLLIYDGEGVNQAFEGMIEGMFSGT